MKRIARHGGLGLLILMAVSLFPIEPAGAEILFKADFETGDFSQFSGKSKTIQPGHIEVVTDFVCSGKYAGRFSIHEDNIFNARQLRVQVNGPKVTVREGSDTFASFSMFMKEPPRDRDNFFYWEGSPPPRYNNVMTWWVEPKADGTGTVIKYGTGNLGRKGVHWERDFVVGRWHQLGMHIHWSEDPTRGNVKLWWDGETVLDKNVQTKGPESVYFSQPGIHRTPHSKSVDTIYFDDILCATTLEEIRIQKPNAETPKGTSRTALAPGNLAIRNVTVIPIGKNAVLRDAGVLVRDGRIAFVGKASDVTVPEGTKTIDGRGKFLIPGLSDMHAHLYSDDEAPDSVAADELGVMLANGITTIRLMIGTPEHQALRREIEAGRVVGPQLWVASPQFTGRKDVNCRVVTTPDEARAAVKEVADAGYDFIKLTVDITPDVFDAVVAAARERNIPIVGHVDPRVGVRRALKAGQHIEHLDNYLETILRDDAPSRRSVSNYDVFRPENWTSLDFMDSEKLRQIARETAESGTYTTPTLTIPKFAFGLGQTDDEIRARPEWVLMPPKTRALYLRANERYWKTAASEERRRRYVAIRNQLVKEIRDAGGKIMAGSDSPEWFFGYGYTLHRELESLVAAGLTPYQALEAATATPASFVNAAREWGRIEPGMRADMVLLSANPLEDIRNTNRIDAVCVGGRWLDRGELDRMLERAGERVGKPAP